jgi:hypothetical protein
MTWMTVRLPEPIRRRARQRDKVHDLVTRTVDGGG